MTQQWSLYFRTGSWQPEGHQASSQILEKNPINYIFKIALEKGDTVIRDFLTVSLCADARHDVHDHFTHIMYIMTFLKFQDF